MREHFEMVFGREKSRRLATYRFFANGVLQNKLFLELADMLVLVVSPRRPKKTDYQRLFETACQNLSLNRGSFAGVRLGFRFSQWPSQTADKPLWESGPRATRPT